MLEIKFLSTFCEIALRWMPQDTFVDRPALVQAMAWAIRQHHMVSLDHSELPFTVVPWINTNHINGLVQDCSMSFQQFTLAINKEFIKALHPLVTGFPAQMASNMKIISVAWHHHEQRLLSNLQHHLNQWVPGSATCTRNIRQRT